VKLLIDGVHFGGQVVLAAWGSMNAAVRTHLALDKDAPVASQNLVRTNSLVVSNAWR
jgi:hypothetical protein